MEIIRQILAQRQKNKSLVVTYSLERSEAEVTVADSHKAACTGMLP